MLLASKAAQACPALLRAEAALCAAGRQARGVLTSAAALKARQGLAGQHLGGGQAPLAGAARR